MVEAEQIKAPFMIGEFGFSDKSKFYGQTMSNILDFADKYMFHTAQWLWKETSQGSWGFWDYDEELGDYILREESARKTARAYPSKISGTMSSFNHNNKYKILEIELENVKEAGYHKVIWPIKYGYSKTPQILCGTDIIKYKMNEYGELSFTCKKKFIRITN